MQNLQEVTRQRSHNKNTINKIKAPQKEIKKEYTKEIITKCEQKWITGEV